jgi:hypothetical protein
VNSSNKPQSWIAVGRIAYCPESNLVFSIAEIFNCDDGKTLIRPGRAFNWLPSSDCLPCVVKQLKLAKTFIHEGKSYAIAHHEWGIVLTRNGKSKGIKFPADNRGDPLLVAAESLARAFNGAIVTGLPEDFKVSFEPEEEEDDNW